MRIVSCDVTYFLKQLKRDNRKTYVENSVLDSGKWYKMSLPSTGMYKITYSELAEMGLPVASINPKNIRIYHNGGGVLPMLNSAERHQDLVEIPIYIYGENDGAFNENDYIIFYARGPLTWDYSNGVYSRISNPYSDYSYAFLTADKGEGKRIQLAENIADETSVNVNSFLDYKLKEDNLYKLFDVDQRSILYEYPNGVMYDYVDGNYMPYSSLEIATNIYYNVDCINFWKMQGVFRYKWRFLNETKCY